MAPRDRHFLRAKTLDGKRFYGEARLDKEQVFARRDAEIGRDHVAGREVDYVARVRVHSGYDRARRDNVMPWVVGRVGGAIRRRFQPLHLFVVGPTTDSKFVLHAMRDGDDVAANAES